MRRIKLTDMINLKPKQALFVIEFVKDGGTRRAAEAAGYTGDYGYKLREIPEIADAIDRIFQDRLEANMIDTDWLLYEMVDNHMIARQQGNISASNTALGMVGKHKRVDAFAADKVMVSTDADVMDRLNSAKKRLRKSDDVSFF